MHDNHVWVCAVCVTCLQLIKKCNNKGLCTHFQLILLTRDNNSDKAASEESFCDFRVHIALAIENLVNFIDTLDWEKLVATIIGNR